MFYVFWLPSFFLQSPTAPPFWYLGLKFEIMRHFVDLKTKFSSSSVFPLYTLNICIPAIGAVRRCGMAFFEFELSPPDEIPCFLGGTFPCAPISESDGTSSLISRSEIWNHEAFCCLEARFGFSSVFSLWILNIFIGNIPAIGAVRWRGMAVFEFDPFPPDEIPRFLSGSFLCALTSESDIAFSLMCCSGINNNKLTFWFGDQAERCCFLKKHTFIRHAKETKELFFVFWRFTKT